MAQAAFNNSSEAIADYSRAIRLKPSANYYVARGLAYLNQGNSLLALFDFGSASQLAPSSARRFYTNALSFYTLRVYNLAIQNLNQAIQLDPAFAQPYSLLGTIYLELGSTEEGLQNYRRYLQLAGRYADPNIENSVRQIENPSS